MRGQSWLLAGVALVLTTGTAPAQTYTLKIKSHPDPGKSVTVTDTSKLKMLVSVAAGGNVQHEDTKASQETKQYTETVLETDARGLRRYTRTYNKINKIVNGENIVPSYTGKTLLFERLGDTFVVRAQQGGVDAKDLQELSKSANHDVDQAQFVPKRPIAVGDTWTIPKEVFAPLLDEMKDGYDPAQVKATGKLVKAYKKANQQWATVDITVTAPVNKFGPLPLKKPLVLQVKLTLDAAIDGSSTASQLKGQLTMHGSAPIEQQGQTYTFFARIESEDRQDQSAEK